MAGAVQAAVPAAAPRNAAPEASARAAAPSPPTTEQPKGLPPSRIAVVRRSCADGDGDGDGRCCDECAERATVRRTATPTGDVVGPAPPSVHSALAAAGRPLGSAVRRQMEGALGADFGAVRVHTDGSAAQSAVDIGADAYALGSHLVFAPGRYDPDTSDGTRLLAHELAHVVAEPQSPPADAALWIGAENDLHERQADVRAGGLTARTPSTALPERAHRAVVRRSPAAAMSVDELSATMLNALYDPQLESDPRMLVMEARLLQEKFLDEDRPLSRIVAARKLIEYRQRLLGLSAGASHDDQGALTTRTIWGDVERWDERGATSVDTMSPFEPEHVAEWVRAVTEARFAGVRLPGGSSSRGRAPASSPPQPAATGTAAQPAAAADTIVAGLGVEQEQTESERASAAQGGGVEIARGLQVMRTMPYRALEEALVTSFDAVAAQEGDPSHARRFQRSESAGVVANYVGQVWFLSRRLHQIDRTGHLAGELALDISGITLQRGGVYFVGRFASGMAGSDWALPMVLPIRIDTSPPVTAGGQDIFPASVLNTLIPLLQEAGGVISRGGGIGIIVSRSYGQATPSFDSDRLLAVLGRAHRYVGWALRTRLYTALAHPTEELFNQALGFALGKLARLIPVVGPAMLMYQLLQVAAWMGEVADIAGRARTDDEIDLAAQDTARALANFAVDMLVSQGIERAEERVRGGAHAGAAERAGTTERATPADVPAEHTTPSEHPTPAEHTTPADHPAPTEHAPDPPRQRVAVDEPHAGGINELAEEIAHEGDGAERVTSTDGHDVKVTRGGYIVVCTECMWLRERFAAEIAADPSLYERVSRAEARARAGPLSVASRDELSALVRDLQGARDTRLTTTFGPGVARAARLGDAQRVFDSAVQRRPRLAAELTRVQQALSATPAGVAVDAALLAQADALQVRVARLAEVDISTESPRNWRVQEVSVDRTRPDYWYTTAQQVPERTVLEFPDGSRVWRDASGVTRHEAVLGSGPGRGGLERTNYSAGEHGNLPLGPDYERAHSLGQGTGFESPYAIYYAPSYVNQILQNQGIEAWMRDLAASAGPGERFQVQTVTRPHGASLRLAHIDYRVQRIANGRIETVASYAIDVTNSADHPTSTGGPLRFADTPSGAATQSRVAIPPVLATAASHTD